MVVVPTLAHQPAMIMRRLRTLAGPVIGQLDHKNQNKENAEDRFAGTVDHGAIMPNQGDNQSKQRNRAKNLCHIKIRTLLLLKKPAFGQ